MGGRGVRMGIGIVRRRPGLLILLSARFQGRNEEHSSLSSDDQDRNRKTEMLGMSVESEVIEDED